MNDEPKTLGDMLRKHGFLNTALGFLGAVIFHLPELLRNVRDGWQRGKDPAYRSKNPDRS